MSDQNDDILTDDGLDANIDAALSGENDDLTPEDIGLEVGAGDDDPLDGEGGGDIDDPGEHDDQQGTRIDYAQQRQQRLAEAKNVADAWDAEAGKAEQTFTDVQNKLREIRQDVDASEDDALKAETAVMDARHELNKMRDGQSQARTYYENESQKPEIAPAAQAWLSANRRYGSDEKFTQAAQKAMGDLKQAGMDETHQEFYRKVDAKLRKAPPMRQNRSASGQGVTRTGAGRGAQRGDDAKLTRAEQKYIRDIGLNPESKNVQQEWTRNKAQVRRMVERNRGAR